MRTGILLTTALCLAGFAVRAELADQHFVIGDQQVWIEIFENRELMWVGPNRYERVQVLSGANVEIVAVLADAEAEAMLSARALVAVVLGTHSCENLQDPREYYVVTLGEELATDGPLTTCVELEISTTPGAIVLEEDPMGDGEFFSWVPGQGFGGAAN
jgi:hypothetical protein